MSRTALALTNLVANGGIDYPAGSPIDQSNGMSIAITTTGMPATPNLDRVVLLVASTSVSDQVLTVKAGAAPVPAFKGGQGDLAVTLHAATGGAIVGPFETAKYMQANGSLLLDFDSGSQGMITALAVPRSW